MVALDHAGLEVLDLETCLDLLDSVPVGRVAFVQAGDVTILPVNHRRDGRTVVFRSALGSKLDAAVRVARVSFEVDQYDEAAETGWSVLVVGSADIVIDEEDRARLDTMGLRPWPDAEARPHWIRIRPDEISGRRLP